MKPIDAQAPPTGALLRGSSSQTDPVAAARDLARQIGGSPAALRVVFCSPELDPDLLGPALFGEFADAPLVGCTTAGEIGPGGYLPTGGLAGFSLPAGEFEVDLVHLQGLRSLGLPEMRFRAAELAARHRSRTSFGRSFGLLLVDGLAVREEPLVSSIHSALGGIPICGGSAGDGLDFGSTRLLVDGALVEDAATLVMVRTRRPFQPVKLQHFRSRDSKLVVTSADPSRRIVHEIDGLPAAEGYAAAIGMRAEELSPQMFSTHPVVVRVGGNEYVRSIQKVNPDGSLTFFCAIDDGIVLTVAEGEDMVANLAAEAHRLEAELGEIELTIGFDCVLRRLESQQKGLVEDIDRHLGRLRTCGFATYGEQFGAMHVNQTLTGIVIGAGRRQG